MRRCGIGHKGLEKLCGVMDMPAPVARENYDKLSYKLSRHCKNCVLHASLRETNPTAYKVWKVDHQEKCEYGKHFCRNILPFNTNLRFTIS